MRGEGFVFHLSKGSVLGITDFPLSGANISTVPSEPPCQIILRGFEDPCYIATDPFFGNAPIFFLEHFKK
jgi:hypothetical protein